MGLQSFFNIFDDRSGKTAAVHPLACCFDKLGLNFQSFDVVSKQHCMLIVQFVKNALFVQTEPGWVGGSVNFFSGIHGTVKVATPPRPAGRGCKVSKDVK